MLCPECGASINRDYARCPWCGTLQSPPGQAARPTDAPPPLTEAEEAFAAPLFRFPPLTVAILIVNVALFILLELHGGSKDQFTLLLFGAKLRAPIQNGEYWRLLVADFLHIGFWHLLLNSLTLVQLGMICENIYGRIRFFLLYVITGVAGFAASTLFTDTLSAGASSSLFGLMGTTLTFGWRHQEEIPPTFRPYFTWYLLPWVVVMIAFGLFYGGIDNWAHIGGLVAGLLLGLVFRNQILIEPGRRRSRLPVSVAFVAIAFFCLSSIYQAWFRIGTRLDLARAMGPEDPAGRIEVMSRLIDADSSSGLYFYLRAQAQREAKRIEAAEADLREALARGFDPATVKNELAWLMLTEGELTKPRLEESVKLAREAVAIERDPAFQNTLGYALYLRGDLQPAIVHLEAAYRGHGEPDRILDLYILAMVWQKKGDPDRARQKFVEGHKLQQELEAPDEEIERFRRLAEGVLGIKPG